MKDQQQLVQGLLQPGAYPHRPPRVELAQTQMSFVFLTGEYAYKVKKAVDLGYLDYTTLDKRRFFCHQEVLLNRRLAAPVYLGVVEVVLRDGEVRVEGPGEVVEYAVKMRQLPRERMLDALLRRDEVEPPMLQAVARKLARFHREAATSAEISRFGSLVAVAANTQENFSQTQPYIGLTLSRRHHDALVAYTQDFLRQQRELFEERIREGRIRDCHGDLHAAHICFAEDIYIYDCIEFNDRFRYGDVASEVAFLAMDLDLHNRPDLARAFVATYKEESGDGGLGRLLDFYRCYRAYVRGKVEGFKLSDPFIPEPEKASLQALARRYFDLALAYARGGARPRLVITPGLVGSGKTTLAQALSRRTGMRVFSSDEVRKGLAGIPATEHRYEAPEQGLYSPESTRRTYDELLARARAVLERGGGVILDASFRSGKEREQAQALAREKGAEFRVVEVACPEELVKVRLEQRLWQLTASDARWEVYLAHRASFDPVSGYPPRQHLVVDSSHPPAQVAEEVADWLVWG